MNTLTQTYIHTYIQIYTYIQIDVYIQIQIDLRTNEARLLFTSLYNNNFLRFYKGVVPRMGRVVPGQVDG